MENIKCLFAKQSIYLIFKPEINQYIYLFIELYS